VDLNIQDIYSLAGSKSDIAASEPGAGAATEPSIKQRNGAAVVVPSTYDTPTLNGAWPVNTWFQRRIKLVYRLKAEGRFYGR